MKKKEISKNKWLTLFAFITGLLVTSIAGLVLMCLSATQKTEEYKAYSYQHKTNLDYGVHLRSNPILSETVQQPGGAYLKSLTDYISTDFKYNFTGDKKAEIRGMYSVKANLIASMNGEKEEQVVWEKEYPVLTSQNFNASGNEVSIQKSVDIPLAEYLSYAEWAMDETNFRPANLKLIVKYDVQLTSQTDSGMVEEELVPALVIPLDSSTFTVGGDLQKEDKGEITNTRTVSVKWVQAARIIFMIVSGILVVLLVAFLRLIVPKKESKKSPQEKNLSRILRKYGSRIVMMNKEDSYIPKNTFDVDSFEDLLKVADELGMPILYHNLKGEVDEQYSFYVLTPTYSYRYTITVQLNNKQEEEILKLSDQKNSCAL